VDRNSTVASPGRVSPWRRSLVIGGTLFVGFAAIGSTASQAATLPVATLAKKADAICKMENGKRAKNPNPPKFSNPAKATAAQIKSAGGYLGRDLAITRDEVAKVFALGTPSEPAAARAWSQLRVVLVKQSLPAFAKAVAAARAGDVKAVVADFAVSDKLDATQVKLQKEIGLKVCGAG
jgi:hypothetical protein